MLTIAQEPPEFSSKTKWNIFMAHRVFWY